MRAKFDRAYAARKPAGYTPPIGRGIRVSLYEQAALSPVTLVSAGAGLAHPAIAEAPLSPQEVGKLSAERDSVAAEAPADEPPLTIAQAKRHLAASVGVAKSDNKISN